jgi:hypothetical protein
MVASVYTFDPKTLPEGSAKLRWMGRGQVTSAVQWTEKPFTLTTQVREIYVFFGVE